MSCTLKPINLHQILDSLQTLGVEFMCIPGNIPEEMSTCDVIFVGVTVENSIDQRQTLFARHHTKTGINNHGLVRAPDKQGITVGILAVFITEQNGQRPNMSINEICRINNF